MKKLSAALGLMLLPAFGGDPQNLLPKASVTIHDTMGAYEACFAVAKQLGVQVQVVYTASLRTGSIELDLDNVPGAKAFDVITTQVNQIWGARPSPLTPGQVLVIISDPPPQPK